MDFGLRILRIRSQGWRIGIWLMDWIKNQESGMEDWDMVTGLWIEESVIEDRGIVNGL
jgi:hypothetical protein